MKIIKLNSVFVISSLLSFTVKVKGGAVFLEQFQENGCKGNISMVSIANLDTPCSQISLIGACTSGNLSSLGQSMANVACGEYFVGVTDFKIPNNLPVNSVWKVSAVFDQKDKSCQTDVPLAFSMLPFQDGVCVKSPSGGYIRESCFESRTYIFEACQDSACTSCYSTKFPPNCNPGETSSQFCIIATSQLLSQGVNVSSLVPGPSPPSPPSPSPSSTSTGLSGGAIAGIVIGCLAALAIIAAGTFFFLKKRNSSTDPSNLPLETAIPIKDSPQPTQEKLLVKSQESIAPSNQSSEVTIAPSLATLSSIWINKPCEAILTRLPEQEDEMMLNSGDVVVLGEVFEDGWGRGVNQSTKQPGAVPLAALMRL